MLNYSYAVSILNVLRYILVLRFARALRKTIASVEELNHRKIIGGRQASVLELLNDRGFQISRHSYNFACRLRAHALIACLDELTCYLRFERSES